MTGLLRSVISKIIPCMKLQYLFIMLLHLVALTTIVFSSVVCPNKFGIIALIVIQNILLMKINNIIILSIYIISLCSFVTFLQEVFLFYY